MVINNAVQGISSVYAPTNTVKKTAAVETKTQEADEVQLSATGQTFSAILNRLKNGSSVRQDKVVYYENLVMSGQYNVDSNDIAAKMLESRY